MSRSQWSGGAVAVCVLTTFVGMAPSEAAATEQRQEVSRAFDRTVNVSSGQSFRIDHRHGDIRITTHARSELRVQATIRVSADSQQAATAFMDRIQIDLTEAPTGVTVRTRYPHDEMRGSRNLSFAVDYSVLMPERMALEVRNSFGNVSAAGVKGEAVIVNAHGRLTASDGAGRTRLENSFGAIEAARLAGDVTITGANGAVSATTIGGALNVTNRFGRVTATAVNGAALVTNSNGEVAVTDALSATVRNSFGLVTIRDVRQDVTVTNSNGGVTGGNLGRAAVTTSFGAVDLKSITGTVTVNNANGNVSLRDVAGAVDVRGSFGRVDIQAVKAGVRVTSANSSVRVADVEGPAFVKTSFGLVAAERVRGSLTVENANGGVQASGVASGVDVSTTFGPVVIRDVGGAVNVRNQNGAIEAAVTEAKAGACQEIRLATSFSPIQVQLPEGGYTVSAATSFGRIHSDLPITQSGTFGEGRLSGTIGAGGCALQLTNSNGDIRIVKRAP